MGRKEINLEKYVSEVKRNINLSVSDELIEKDLLLTLVLAEFQKHGGVFNELIFKGGTLLSRNYLKYHRFSEDLDFVYEGSNELRKLTRNRREKKIKEFIDVFAAKLNEVAETLELDFSTNRSDQKYCSILSGRTVYIFRLYYSDERYMKVEINFIEKTINKPVEIVVKSITDFFDSKELMFILGLKTENFKVLSYSISEIILEKYRALLTRNYFMERDLFDLFLIPNSLDIDVKNAIDKIESSSLIKKQVRSIIEKKLEELKKGSFFSSTEQISDLAIIKYNAEDFEKFKEKITPLLIKICEEFLKNY
ncbi:MAG: nucleotidyl transferase AbiEii/AbiGii toxin family protein [Nanoarchaeota archaeon]